MDILISGGIVSAKPAPNTPRVILARTVANYLPLACQRAGARIVRNEDAKYIGIRLDTVAGPVVLEIPSTPDAPFRIVHELIEPDAKGREAIEKLRIPQIYQPAGVAFHAAEFLRSRGFLAPGT